VVSAPPDVQLHRVRLRGRMSDSQIRAMIALQMPDAKKRAGADTVVLTGLSRFHAAGQIKRFVINARATR